MMTIREVANRYGVTVGFMLQALARIGYCGAKAEQPLSAATVARFEKEWGTKIRAARPKPPPAFRGGTDVAPSSARSARQPTPHVMRIAHARVTGGRDSAGNRVPRLLDDPGLVHAIDAVGTWDGDPWRGEVVPGAIHFFGGPMKSGPTAACGWAHMRAVLGDEFQPDPDPEEAGQCPRCAEVVTDGQGFRNPPGSHYRLSFCEKYLRVRIDGRVTVKDCSLRDFHDGPHRARDGAEWEIGVDDYVPAPDEVGSRVTEAS